MALETRISEFLAAHGLKPAALASAAGVLPEELEDMLNGVNVGGEAASRVKRCMEAWAHRHATCCEGFAVLEDQAEDIWKPAAQSGTG